LVYLKRTGRWSIELGFDKRGAAELIGLVDNYCPDAVISIDFDRSVTRTKRFTKNTTASFRVARSNDDWVALQEEDDGVVALHLPDDWMVHVGEIIQEFTQRDDGLLQASELIEVDVPKRRGESSQISLCYFDREVKYT